MAAPPIVVTLPGGALVDDSPILLAANDPLVVAYPCLPWDTAVAAAGGVPQAALPQFIAIRTFLWRNSVGASAADKAAAATRSPITISFLAAAWSRWLTELVASGLLANAPFVRIRDSDSALSALTFNAPAQM